MSLRMSRGKLTQIAVGRGMAAEAEAARVLAANKAAAGHTIALYNAQLAERGADICWTPLLSAALLAGRPWLQVHCPGCDTIAAVDLRVVRRPATTALTAIAEKLACSRCLGSAPAPRIVRLTARHDGDG